MIAVGRAVAALLSITVFLIVGAGWAAGVHAGPRRPLIIPRAEILYPPPRPTVHARELCHENS